MKGSSLFFFSPPSDDRLLVYFLSKQLSILCTQIFPSSNLDIRESRTRSQQSRSTSYTSPTRRITSTLPRPTSALCCQCQKPRGVLCSGKRNMLFLINYQQRVKNSCLCIKYIFYDLPGIICGHSFNAASMNAVDSSCMRQLMTLQPMDL